MGCCESTSSKKGKNNFPQNSFNQTTTSFGNDSQININKGNYLNDTSFSLVSPLKDEISVNMNKRKNKDSIGIDINKRDSFINNFFNKNLDSLNEPELRKGIFIKNQKKKMKISENSINKFLL